MITLSCSVSEIDNFNIMNHLFSLFEDRLNVTFNYILHIAVFYGLSSLLFLCQVIFTSSDASSLSEVKFP